MNTAIKFSNLSKTYWIDSSCKNKPYLTLGGSISALFSRKGNNFQSKEKLEALKGINLTISKGEKIGIIGHNGAGKTTLLKIVSRITPPSSGSVSVYGRVGSLLEVGSGFHPELSCRENIFLNGAILGMSRHEIQSKLPEIIKFAEIGTFINTPVKHLSSGLYMRLAFSVAAHLDCEIVLVDEVLAVGDIAFQNKCIGKMSDIADQGRTILFVSHNLTTIRQFCTKAILLDHGTLTQQGEVNQVINSYLSTSSETTSTSWINKDKEERLMDAYINKVIITDLNGVPNKVFLNTDCVLVKMEVIVKKASPDLKVGFDLFYQGSLAFRSQQVDSYPNIKPLKKGNNILTCIIPGGLLNKGVYYIAPIFALHAIRTLRKPKSPVIDFTVDVNPTVNNFHGLLNSISQPGPVFPILNWENE